MKSLVKLVLFSFLLLPVMGCRGISSEMQKADMHSASASVAVAGTEIHLDTKLSQSPKAKGFDLIGSITLSPTGGAFPAGTAINRFSLKPSWKGWPGYYVMNFVRQNGDWVLPGVYGNDANFFATDKMVNGTYVIEFIWRNQGRGLGTKLEHFAAYDVGVTILDGSGKKYLLVQLDVPTK
jgi:hypothetical protein